MIYCPGSQITVGSKPSLFYPVHAMSSRSRKDVSYSVQRSRKEMPPPACRSSSERNRSVSGSTGWASRRKAAREKEGLAWWWACFRLRAVSEGQAFVFTQRESKAAVRMWCLFRSFGWAAMCNLAGTYLIGKSNGVRLSEVRLRFCFGRPDG